MGKREDDAAYYQRNKERVKARTQAYYEANRDVALVKQRAYYEANKEVRSAGNRAWADANKEKMREYHRQYVKRNRALWSAQTATYRAAKKNATPAWVDLEAVRALYAQARALKESMGAEWHVDHIVPLQSDLVCGLHVQGNLQLLPGRANRKKSNRHWPDMPT